MSNIFNSEAEWEKHWQLRNKSRENLQYCSRCVLDSSIKGVTFDDQGVCNYCKIQDDLGKDYPGGKVGEKRFAKLVEEIKEKGKDNKYDVIIGVSGGADSSYMLHLAKVVYGLRPLAVHFDNTWNSTIATMNIKKVTEALDIDLYTHVVSNEEFDDSCRSILKSGVPDLEIQTDLALAATMNQAAEKYNIKYVFEGHSFRSEGICPSGWFYMDSKYLNDVQKKHGRMKLKSLPHMWLSSQLKWMLFNQVKKIRPLWILDYDKEKCKKLLTELYDWEWYGGHHLENRMTAFLHSYFMPRRWDIDQRANGFSGTIRSGFMTREDAMKQLKETPKIDEDIIDMVKKRLDLTNQEFIDCMNLPKKSYRDFKSYKRTFEIMRPFFYIMAKQDLIPWSFYIKYTAKAGAN